jgi:asparagine synthase (glutamine-hydrolysing)
VCGIAGIFGKDWTAGQLLAMRLAQQHRGPDAEGLYLDRDGHCGLAHNRLSIIDLSPAGRQPMENADGNLQIVLNGEIYNFLELRQELKSSYEFRTSTDTEVLLAAYEKWGVGCLDKLIGMFAFIIWDEINKTAFAARDRFGVKPLYLHQRPDGTVFAASEIKALHAAGIKREPNPKSWSQYLSNGHTDSSSESFWLDINPLQAGHFLTWTDGTLNITRWYDLAEKVGKDFDERSSSESAEEYLGLMKDSVRLRFRADVPVGINLSGGLDSSTLLSIVRSTQAQDDVVKAFTFVTGDAQYDELPWVKQMINSTNHPLIVSRLSPEEVPEMATSVMEFQDEPYGGIPTLAYAKLFESAKANGVKVLLDGNGMDEQWGGYDYYQFADRISDGPVPIIQGSNSRAVRPECLAQEFRSMAQPVEFQQPFPDRFRSLQYRDTVYTKIPRAMRFNDRISMRSSTELREPFLDHRLVELAFRQPQNRKRVKGIGKKMLRDMVRQLMPSSLNDQPKRPVQTPQREWLRGPLREWANDCIISGLNGLGREWFCKHTVLSDWKSFCEGDADNSFFVWQWITVGLMSK